MKPQVRLFIAAAMIVSPIAQTLFAQPTARQQAWFPDGTGLEVYTESTGSTKPLSGATGIGPGIGSKDLVFREVVDTANNVRFAYNLEASRGAVAGTVAIRIEPLTAKAESSLLKDPAWAKISRDHIPTVAAVREFSSVKLGEAVTLDILYNPATGEKIYDVLRPLAGPSPADVPPGGMSVQPIPLRAEVSLKEIAVKVNGHAVQAPSSWLIGAAVRIDIPRHGTYVVAAYDPKNQPPIYKFQSVAHAEGKTLSWRVDGEQIQIDSSTNVLTQAASGVLWVYHDPKYRSQGQPNTVSLQTADTVEWLIPR